MNLGQEFAKTLRAVSAEGAIRPAASDKTIAQTQERYGVRLSNDMAWFYRAMNGMNSPTRPDNGWIRIWDLESGATRIGGNESSNFRVQLAALRAAAETAR